MSRLPSVRCSTTNVMVMYCVKNATIVIEDDTLHWSLVSSAPAVFRIKTEFHFLNTFVFKAHTLESLRKQIILYYLRWCYLRLYWFLFINPDEVNQGEDK